MVPVETEREHKKIAFFAAGTRRPNTRRQWRGCERRTSGSRHTAGAQLRELRGDGSVSAAIDSLNERTEVNIVIAGQETQAEDETNSSEIC